MIFKFSKPISLLEIERNLVTVASKGTVIITTILSILSFIFSNKIKVLLTVIKVLAIWIMKNVLNKASLNTLNLANNIKMSVAQPIKVGHRDSYFPQSICWHGWCLLAKKPITAFLLNRTNDDNVRHCKLTQYGRISLLLKACKPRINETTEKDHQKMLTPSISAFVYPTPPWHSDSGLNPKYSLSTCKPL